MNTNNVKTKLVASILAVILLFITIPSVYVSAENRSIDSSTLNVGGTIVDIISVTGEKMASGTTAANYYNPDITASVYAKYYSVDPSIMSYLPQEGYNQGTSSAVVSFLAPENHVTDHISCNHSAKKGYYPGENGNTYARYNWYS